MRLFLAAAALSFAAACSQSTAAPDSSVAAVEIAAPAEDTRVVAVMTYASWCGSCKALDPKVKAVQSANTFDGVEFFTIDYTDKDADAFFADAATIGVEAAMRDTFSEKVKTGKLYLIDLASGDVVGTVDKSMDEAAITQAIEDAAALS